MRICARCTPLNESERNDLALLTISKSKVSFLKNLHVERYTGGMEFFRLQVQEYRLLKVDLVSFNQASVAASGRFIRSGFRLYSFELSTSSSKKARFCTCAGTGATRCCNVAG